MEKIQPSIKILFATANGLQSTKKATENVIFLLINWWKQENNIKDIAQLKDT